MSYDDWKATDDRDEDDDPTTPTDEQCITWDSGTGTGETRFVQFPANVLVIDNFSEQANRLLNQYCYRCGAIGILLMGGLCWDCGKENML